MLQLNQRSAFRVKRNKEWNLTHRQIKLRGHAIDPKTQLPFQTTKNLKKRERKSLFKQKPSSKPHKPQKVPCPPPSTPPIYEIIESDSSASSPIHSPKIPNKSPSKPIEIWIEINSQDSLDCYLDEVYKDYEEEVKREEEQEEKEGNDIEDLEILDVFNEKDKGNESEKDGYLKVLFEEEQWDIDMDDLDIEISDQEEGKDREVLKDITNQDF